jgi:hypothetical protein
MEYLLSHDAEAESMGCRGRQAACELYNWNSEEACCSSSTLSCLRHRFPKGKEDKNGFALCYGSRTRAQR